LPLRLQSTPRVGGGSAFYVRRMNIPRKEDWPEEIEAIRNIPVELPRLSPDSLATCPVTMQEILEYLGYEAPGGEHSGSEEVIPFQLEFVRAALVEATRYWLWRFADSRGTECYVMVDMRPDGTPCTGYDESFGLTPEQFILAAHYDTIL
jgi:hypothetical protein